MTVANIITLGRIALVPLIVWTLLSGQYGAAFALFLAAGLSDAVDGIVARVFNQRSALGEILDPLADKLMMLFVFVALSHLGHLPVWLVVIVVGRDVGLVAAAAIASLMGKHVTIAPLFISKVTTTLQITLAAVLLFELAFDFRLGWAEPALIWAVAGFTVASGVVYLYLRSCALLTATSQSVHHGTPAGSRLGSLAAKSNALTGLKDLKGDVKGQSAKS
ncbi:MAG: CDP-alcohol phosphatidyltransferase family protein [Pseudomonadota bacterium]